MKKYYLMIAAVVLACASMVSCQPKAEEDIKTKIELLTPADGANYNVAAGEALTISWKGADGACSLLVSDKADLTSAVETAGVTSPYYLQAEKVDEILAGFGVAEGASGKLYIGVACGSEKSAAHCVNATRKVAPVTPVIALAAPADKAVIDLNAATEVTFSWTKAEDIDDYVLLFSMDGQFSSSVEEKVGNVSSQTYASAKAFNNVMGQLGIKAGATATVYWTVITTVKKEVETQVRSFDVTRIASALVEPDNKARVELEYETPDALVTFSWADVADSYELYVGLDEAMEQSVKIADATSTSISATHAEIQAAAIDFEESPLHRYADNTLYWNVKLPDGSWLAEKANSFVLRGMMVFRDFRHEEEGEIVYHVTHVKTDSYDAFWLAEDLKTMYSVDGTHFSEIKVEGTSSGYNQFADYGLEWEGKPDWTGDDYRKTDKVIPRYFIDLGTVYYRSTADTPKYLNKDGWCVPTAEEISKLFNEAMAASPKKACVIRDYDRYAPDEFGTATYDYQWDADKENWNTWHMNMGPNGIYYYGRMNFAYFHSDRDHKNPTTAYEIFYTIDTSNDSANAGKHFWFWNDEFQISYGWWDDAKSLCPVRMIYKGR